MGFFSTLLGKDSANAATQLGQRNEGRLNSGYAEANNYAKTGYDTSMARFQPFAEQGQRGFNAYNDAIGANGGDARQRQFQNFESDPFLAYANQNNGTALNAMFGKYNARGMGNSGASRLAVQRVAGEQAQGNVNNWLGRLQGAGQQGLQIAGQQVGLDQGYYGGMGDRAIGRVNALNNNDTLATQAANNARMAGMNNLLSGIGSIGGMAISGFAPGASGVSRRMV